MTEVFYYSATLTNINFLWHQLQYDCDTNCKANQKSDLSTETKFLLKFSVFSLYQINVQSPIFWCDVNNFSEMNYVKFEAVQEISEDNPSIAQGLLNNRYHCKLIQKCWLDINWLRTIEKLDQFSGFDELMTLFTKINYL